MRYIFFLVIAFTVSLAPLSAGAREAEKRILYLNSYHNGYAWSDSILKGIRSVLPMEIQNLNFQVEYLDAKQHDSPSMQAVIFDFYREKFKDDRFNVVIIGNSGVTAKAIIQVTKAALTSPAPETSSQKRPSFKLYKQEMEQKYLEEIVTTAGGDLKTILDWSGLSKSHFYSLLKKYNISIYRKNSCPEKPCTAIRTDILDTIYQS